jgi:hypothetical protein
MHRMTVPAIFIPNSQAQMTNYKAAERNANLAQASERLGINKMFQGGKGQQPKMVYSNANGQDGTWYQPLYANLPFDVPVSNFDYAAEHDSQDYFRNFFEDHRSAETPASLSETGSENEADSNEPTQA